MVSNFYGNKFHKFKNFIKSRISGFEVLLSHVGDLPDVSLVYESWCVLHVHLLSTLSVLRVRPSPLQSCPLPREYRSQFLFRTCCDWDGTSIVVVMHRSQHHPFPLSTRVSPVARGTYFFPSTLSYSRFPLLSLIFFFGGAPYVTQGWGDPTRYFSTSRLCSQIFPQENRLL